MPDEEANMTDEDSNDTLPALNKKMSKTLSVGKRTKTQVEQESLPCATSSPSTMHYINTHSDEEELVMSDEDSPALPNSKVKAIALADLNRYSDNEII